MKKERLDMVCDSVFAWLSWNLELRSLSPLEVEMCFFYCMVLCFFLSWLNSHVGLMVFGYLR